MTSARTAPDGKERAHYASGVVREDVNMACRVIHGRQDGIECAVMFCSTTGWAFGPVFNNAEQVERFIQMVPGDPRTRTDKELESLYADFLRLFVCECGALRGEDEEPTQKESYECSYCQKETA